MSVTTEPTDPELLQRMAEGDREALAIIFRRHHGTVYRFSRQMLGSNEAAEDVTQDVFVALTKSAGRFNPAVASLSTYLYGIARNLVLQRYKRTRARVEVNIDTVASEDEAAFATSSDPTEMIARAQATRELRRAILCLPMHYREVVVLCELNRLSYEDAAAIAGCPMGTVRSRLSRARQMLIERCRTALVTDRAESKEQRAECKEQSAERTKRWTDSNEAQLLNDLLNDIAREDASLAAAHLEARVMSACARTTPPSSGATRLPYWTIAAAVALAVFLPTLVSRDVPRHATEMQVEPIEQPITETARMVPESPVPMRPARRARPAPPARPTMPTPPTIPESSPDEFLPLMPMTEQELTGPFQLVRVQMPRASLGALRSPLEHPNELVEADVLLGEDGMARAIRVSTSQSVYPWRSR